MSFVQLNSLRNIENFSDFTGGNLFSDNINKVQVAYAEHDYAYLLGVAVVLCIAFLVIRWAYRRFIARRSSMQVVPAYDDAPDKYMHQITPNEEPYLL